MMAHIMERYFTTTDEVETTDRVAEGVLKAIITEAPRVIAEPCNYQARANIMWGGHTGAQRHLRMRTARGLDFSRAGA